MKTIEFDTGSKMEDGKTPVTVQAKSQVEFDRWAKRGFKPLKGKREDLPFTGYEVAPGITMMGKR